MASLQKASTQMSDRNRKDKNHFNSTLVFPVNDFVSGMNKDGKRKEVLECSSRSSVSETEESLLTSSPLETNSSPVQPENQSRNEITKGASSLLEIWEARSQQSSSSQSQSLIDRRISAGLSLLDNLSAVSKSLKDKTKNNYTGEEKEREGRDFLGVVTCSPRIRGRQAFEDLFTKILDDRKEELESIANKYRVSEFSPSRCSRLELMLRIRCLERCIAVQERHRFNRRYKKNIGKVVEAGISSSLVSSQEEKTNKSVEKNVLQGKTEEVKGTMEKSNPREMTRGMEVAKKAVVREDASNKNGLKIERDATEVGETVEKAIAKESVEGNKISVSIAEKVNIWEYSNSKGRTKNEEKNARRVSNVEAIERAKEEVSSFLEQGKSIDTEEYRTSPQKVISVSLLDKIKEEETRSHVSNGSGQEEESWQENEETTNAKKLERLETLCLILESPSFLSDWDENKFEDGEEEGEECSEESVYDDQVSEISKPQSSWEDLRKQWELEVMNESEKEEIQKIINKRPVSNILASDSREEMEKILIRLVRRRLQVESNPFEEQDNEESLVECSESYQAKLEGNETVDLETVSDGFSTSSSRSTTMRSIKDHEAAITVSSDHKDHDNTSSEFKIIWDLQEQIKQLQIEMIELRRLVESHTDVKKSVKLESVSGVDICERV